MRNYIILNGQISTNIQGLLIQELPPISKPKIRTQVEEIDGRDGDIVTPLGYSAYDKEFTIGLYGEFDIDEVIQYFNSEGTVIFSNEDDKFYNYQIVEQIDFERLVRFRTATVKMHVQPFKYSVNDNERIFNMNNNLLSFNNYTETTNGITVAFQNGSITVSGTGSQATEFYIPINLLTLEEGNYVLNALAKGTSPDSASIRVIHDSPTDANSFGGTDVTLENNETVNIDATLTEQESYNYVYFNITAGTQMNFTLELNIQPSVLSNSISIRNSGNIYSKPTLTIYGAGNIGVSLNGVQLFQIALGNLESITIDTTQMEAYNGSNLLNRLVTGDYDNFKLNAGKNTISFSGSVTKVEMQNYSRWI